MTWYFTIGRARQLYPEEVFEEVFTKLLTMCVDKGMVSGHTQAIDSEPVKANVSMDILELKVPKEDLEAHLHSIRHKKWQHDEDQRPGARNKVLSILQIKHITVPQTQMPVSE